MKIDAEMQYKDEWLLHKAHDSTRIHNHRQVADNTLRQNNTTPQVPASAS